MEITELALIFSLLPASQIFLSSGHMPLTPGSLSPLLDPCESLPFVMEAKMNANCIQTFLQNLYMVLAKTNTHRVKYHPLPPLNPLTSLLYSEQMLLGFPPFITKCPLQESQH